MMGYTSLSPCPGNIEPLTDEQITRWQDELRVAESLNEERHAFLSVLNELEDLRALWRWEKVN